MAPFSIPEIVGLVVKLFILFAQMIILFLPKRKGAKNVLPDYPLLNFNFEFRAVSLVANA